MEHTPIIEQREAVMKNRRVTWGKLSKAYLTATDLEALAQFRAEFKAQIPAYKPGTSVSRYMGKFVVTWE